MYNYLYPLYYAIAGLFVGYIMAEAAKNPWKIIGSIIKWISIVIIAMYILIIVAALTDGIGDIPLIGGTVWVSGHWRRK